jgi:Mn-dependent DtxR family transcriptional regulator
MDKLVLMRNVTYKGNTIRYMPQLDPSRRSTNALVEASEIYQTLYPTALASLLLVAEDKRYKQAEIAEQIGCADSTVSKARQSLSKLPLPLLEKGTQQYSVTEAGRAVLTLIDEMAERQNEPFRSVDWSNDDEKASVAELLGPLSDSVSTTPFFILDALGEYSDKDELLGTPSTVPIQKIVRDVDKRREDRGESATTEQVRTILRRLADAGTVISDGPDDCRLTDEGREQARLLDQLAQLIEKSDETEVDVDTSTASLRQDAQSSSATTRSSSSGTRRAGRVANQIIERRFAGGRSSTPVSEPAPEPLGIDATEPLSILPAYCFVLGDDDSTDTTSQSATLHAVLPVTHLTIEELADRVEQLVHEYGEETQLTPYWTLQTESDLYPLGPAELSLDEVSYQAWNLINDVSNASPKEDHSSPSEQGESIDE